MMDENNVIKCRSIIPGHAEGEALVSAEPLCFYLCDPESGIVLDKNHCLKGKSVAGKILIIKSGKGSSVVQLDGLYQLKEKNNLPGAIIIINAEPVIVSSAYVVNLPMVDKLEISPYDAIKDGDHVVIDAGNDEGIVTIN